mmetsp:Transcript_5276/g.10342  ORF Transcript_5276/g.10342 Transcript_5276/m.10342 type:complete len:204 (+) Transcript_5276:75-686(+)
MPSTSFQTCTSSNSAAAPTRLAVRSLPPRPSVVTEPVASLPMKPVMTPTVQGSAGIAATLFLMSGQHASSTLASPNVESVVSPRSQLSICCAGTPRPFRHAATIRPEQRSPYETTRSRVRVESSPSSDTPSSVRSHSSSSRSTSAYSTESSKPSVTAVSACRSRTAERSTTCSSMARSVAASRLLVVLPIAEHTRCGRTPLSI